MKIKSLEQESISNIHSVFQLSFSDYIIPFNLTLSQLEDKIKTENIQLKYSIGAYIEDKLDAFVLHAAENNMKPKHLYNAGTGVIPSKRGRKITLKMYQTAIPLYRKMGINSISLEVIKGNQPAIRAYKNVGFKKLRDLYCYNGNINNGLPIKNLSIKPILHTDLSKIIEEGNTIPSWQNSNSTILRMKEKAGLLGLFKNSDFIGSLIFNKSNNRILQMTILKKHRNRGLGTAFLQLFKMNYASKTTITNLDSQDTATQQFLTKNGFIKSITQHEMHLIIE